MIRRPPRSTLFPYNDALPIWWQPGLVQMTPYLLAKREGMKLEKRGDPLVVDRKSTRLNSSHSQISYAVFCLKKKKNNRHEDRNDDKLTDRHRTITECKQYGNS